MNRFRKLLPWLLLGAMTGCILVLTFLPGLTQYYTLLLFGGAGCCVAALLLAFENHRPSARDLMPVMVLVATASVGRVVFAFLPQVQPVTVLVLCAAATVCPGVAPTTYPQPGTACTPASSSLVTMLFRERS